MTTRWRARDRRAVALAATIVVVGLNMRIAVSTVPPLLDDVRRALGLSGSAGGLVTTLPVLCFGVFAPIVPRLARRLGEEPVMAGGLVLLTLGTAGRAGGTVAALYAGTVVLGVGITLVQVAVPALAKREFGPGSPAVIALYTASLSVGASAAAGASVPLFHAAGGDWRPAVAAWALPAAAATVVWVVATGRRGPSAGRGEPPPAASVWRSPLAWCVAGYLATQAVSYFTMLTWLPSVYESHGLSSTRAGLLLSISTLVQIPGTLVAPLIAARVRDQRGLALAIATLIAAAMIGLVVAPAGGALVWAVLLGAGQGAGFALALTFIVMRSRDHATAAALSGMSQTTGYILAAGGPLVFGFLHDASGGWSLPLLALLGLTTVGLVTIGAGRPRYVT